MWPSTTKMATPTSSQDDRRRPFIVVRLVSGRRHVKRAGRRSDPSELTRLDQVDEHVPFLPLENREIAGLSDADLVAGDLDLRTGGARRAQGHPHSRVGLHHVQWHILIAEKVATLMSGRVIDFGHGPFGRRRSSLRPSLGWWYSQRRTRVQVFALAEAPRWTNTKSVSCWSRSRQAASPVARSCRRWLGWA